jgi:hypothetical protein
MIHDQTSDEHAAPTRTSCRYVPPYCEVSWPKTFTKSRRNSPSPGEIIESDRFLVFQFAKRWSDVFDEASIPDEDLSYMEELRLLSLESKGESVELFLRPYEDDFISPDLETIIRLYGNIKKIDLDGQDKATIWLDDRTYSAYHPNQSLIPITRGPRNDRSVLLPNLPESDNHTPRNADSNPATSSTRGTTGDTHAEPTSSRYSPTSRRPKIPLTAAMLFTLLRIEVISSPTLPAFQPLFSDIGSLLQSVEFSSQKLVIRCSLVSERRSLLMLLGTWLAFISHGS